MTRILASVLTTVNAPYGEQLDAETLAHCLTNAEAAKTRPGHMSCFFGEVPLHDQIAFAETQDISADTLANTAHAFAEYSGETYPLNA